MTGRATMVVVTVGALLLALAPPSGADHPLDGQCFSIDRTEVEATVTVVEFDATGCDAPGATLEWDFGDGATATSTEQRVTHTYDYSGSYTVTLTWSDGDGDHTSSGTVTVGPHATFEVAPDTAGTTATTFRFDASGSRGTPTGGIKHYAWDFGDGTSATGRQPTHTYGREGTYTVTLTVTDGGGSTAQATDTITVGNAPPRMRLSASSTEVVTLEEVVLDASRSSDPDGTELTFTWDLGDGGSAQGPQIVYSYGAPGTYTVTVTAVDGDGVSASASVDIVVSNAPPLVAISPAELQTRPGTPLHLDASGSSDPEGGALEFAWSAPQATPSSGSGPTFAPVWDREGVFEVTLTVTDPEGLATTDVLGVLVDNDLVFRLAGIGRIETSVELARRGFPAADQAILARADDFPDALAASALAAAVDGPVLLTSRDGVHPEVAAELARLGVTHAYLAGGPQALTPDVEADLAATGIAATRLAGPSRFETAAAIAREVVRLTGQVDQAIVALGSHPDPQRDPWPDALVAGNLAAVGRAPILLTAPDAPPRSTLDALSDVLRGGRVWVAGGEAAVGAPVLDRLVRLGYDARRLAGPTRYGTAVVVVEEARRQGAGVEPVVVASGANFPDALAAAPVAWKLGGVLLLVDPHELSRSDETLAWISFHRDGVDTVYVAGGPLAVAGLVRDQLSTVIQDRQAG